MTVLGIDASNLREGGGRTHLIELLTHAEPHLGFIDRVEVWGSRETLALLPTRSWLVPSEQSALEGGLVQRVAWQSLRLPWLARDVDLLFAPGGVTTPLKRPRVVMSRNMLPFDARERARYRGPIRAKLELLRLAQERSFSTSDGVIFLTDYARREVTAALRAPPRRSVTIPHGVNPRFIRAPRPAADAAAGVRIVYVSTVSRYKHQTELVDAVVALRAELPVSLTLIGPDDGTGADRELLAQLARLDPASTFLRYLGKVPFADVDRHYRTADLFAFPSSCENMPNILVEAMSGGLPIACADRGPMPEILGDAGIYFDPDDQASMTAALRRLASDPELRGELAARAHARASRFDWDRCARDTFAFLRSVVG